MVKQDSRKFDSKFSAPIIPKVTIPSLQLSEEEKKKEKEEQKGQPPIPVFNKIAYQPQLLPQYHAYSQLGDRPTKLFVSKINAKITNEFLLKLLEVCGTIDSWQRVKDPITGVFKTYGFCLYKSADGAIKALRNLNGLDINGDVLLVKAQQDTEAFLREYKVKKSLLLFSGNKSEITQIADEKILGKAKIEDDERDKLEDEKIREVIISLFIEEQGISTKLQTSTLHSTSELGAVNTTIERQFKDVDEKIVEEKKQLMTESIRQFRKKETEREKEKAQKEKEREYRKRNESRFNEERIMKRERDRFNFLKDEEERLKRKREKELKYLESKEREREYKIYNNKKYSNEIDEEDEEYLKSKYIKRFEIDHEEEEEEKEELKKELINKRKRKRKSFSRDENLSTDSSDDDSNESEIDEEELNQIHHQKCLSRKKKFNYYEYFSSSESEEDIEIFPEDEEKVIIQIENKEEKEEKEKQEKQDESIKEIFHQNEEEEEENSNNKKKQNLLINFEEIKNEQEIEKQLNPKNIILLIPDSKNELFKFEINWVLVDQFKLIDELKDFIKKKIKEILGSEEETMFEYLIANMSLHCTPETLVSDLEEILGEEANIFVSKVWRMLAFKVKQKELQLKFNKLE